jgi:predicted site-specific integrase-resolvase
MGALFKLLTPKDTASILQVSIGTLANWRCTGEGPSYTKIGRTVRYSPEDIQEFILKGKAA